MTLRRPLLILFLAAAGCGDQEQRQQRDELDFLVRERQHLTTHMTNLHAAATALPPDAGAQLVAYQAEYLQAERRRRDVDARIESVQNQLAVPP